MVMMMMMMMILIGRNKLVHRHTSWHVNDHFSGKHGSFVIFLFSISSKNNVHPVLISDRQKVFVWSFLLDSTRWHFYKQTQWTCSIAKSSSPKQLLKRQWYVWDRILHKSQQTVRHQFCIGLQYGMNYALPMLSWCLCKVPGLGGAHITKPG